MYYQPQHTLTYHVSIQSEQVPATGDSIEQLLQERTELINSRIELITDQMKLRQIMLQGHIYDINLQTCLLEGMILNRGPEKYDRERFTIEQQLQRLSEEKRKIEAGCFRDMLFLHKELRDYLIQQKQEEQMTALFDQYGGEY